MITVTVNRLTIKRFSESDRFNALVLDGDKSKLSLI